MSLTAGTRLGPYEIVAPIGAGGMGEVYKAKDTRLERTVAVKVLPQHLSSSPEIRQRFEREAKTISQLSHSNICALYDVGNADGVEYLVMELLEGETLSDRLAKGALPLEQTLRFGTQITDALDKAHRQGIVHRDLKPGNVMITKSGVKLLDFGLAKAMAPPVQSAVTSLPTALGSMPNNLTQEGTILGTFQYMAPEQLEGREADGRTDIFSFGCVLYEMATGKKAFSGATQASLISSIMKDEPAPISAVAPDGASGARARGAALPREGPGRPLAERGRSRQRAEVDRGRADRRAAIAAPVSLEPPPARLVGSVGRGARHWRSPASPPAACSGARRRRRSFACRSSCRRSWISSATMRRSLSRPTARRSSLPRRAPTADGSSGCRRMDGFGVQPLRRHRRRDDPVLVARRPLRSASSPSGS